MRIEDIITSQKQYGKARCHFSKHILCRKFKIPSDNMFKFREAIFAGRWAWQGVGSVVWEK